MELNDDQEGQLFDICMNLWEQTEKVPSIRYTAIKFILKCAKKHPELENEISFLFQDHYLQSLSPGIKHSINKMMNKLNLQKDF